MTRLRAHHMVLIGLGSALAAVTACSSPEPQASEDAKKTAQASSVAVEVLDANGSSLGSCSGTLIAPKIVLTAGHCIAGAHSWSVSSGSTLVKATVASTSWQNFKSDLSHPQHSDVGLLMLDNPIKLSSYPAVAIKGANANSTAVRYHRAAADSKSAIATSSLISAGDSKGFKLDYLVDMKSNEWLDTGGAVLDKSGAIIGVVSGMGKESKLLHIARVDGFSTWSKKAIACSSGLTTRDYGGGGGDDDDSGWGGGGLDIGWGGGAGDGSGWGGGGGAAWGSSSGGYGGGGGLGNGGAVLDGGAFVPGSNGTGVGIPGDTTSVGSGGVGSGTPGLPGSTAGSTVPGVGSTLGSDTAPNTCPGIPVCEGGACGEGSNGLNSGTGSNINPPGTTLSSGTSTGTLPGDTGTGGTSGGPGTTATGGTSGNPDTGTSGNGGTSSGTSGNPDTGTSGNGGTSSGTSGNPGDTGTSGTGGTSSGGTTSGGPGTGSGEGCSGSTDNPLTCPAAPDSANCAGATCGGCSGAANCSDDNVDYGGIATTQASGSGPVVK